MKPSGLKMESSWRASLIVWLAWETDGPATGASVVMAAAAAAATETQDATRQGRKGRTVGRVQRCDGDATRMDWRSRGGGASCEGLQTPHPSRLRKLTLGSTEFADFEI